jgi:hypothetical protein
MIMQREQQLQSTERACSICGTKVRAGITSNGEIVLLDTNRHVYQLAGGQRNGALTVNKTPRAFALHSCKE